jgi:hypothetical protein
MSVSLSPNLPANVVEIGNEISQAKIDEINAGTLALQTWVSASYLTTASASSTYAPKASPTFTGTVTIPAGASISGYLTTATASSTYQTQAGMSSYLTTATASSTYQTQAGMSSYLTASTAASTYQPIGSYLTDAPSNGNEYVRKNGAWAIATGGSGGVAWGAITGTVTDQTDLTSYISGLGYITSAGLSVTNIDLTGNFNGYSMGSGYYTFKFDSTANTLRMQDGAGSGITISPTGITFPNSSVLTSSPSKSVNAITGAYTLALSDANNIIYADSSAGGGMSYYLTVPDDGTTNFPVGTVISLVANAGSGATIDITTTLMGTPTIYGTTSFAGGQVHQAFLTKVAADTWIIK